MKQTKTQLTLLTLLLTLFHFNHAQSTHLETGVFHETIGNTGAYGVNALGRLNIFQTINKSVSLEAQPFIGYGITQNQSSELSETSDHFFYSAAGGLSFNYGLGATFDSYLFKGFKISVHYGIQSTQESVIEPFITSNAAFRFSALNMNTFTLFAGPKYFTNNQNISFYAGINYNFGLY